MDFQPFARWFRAASPYIRAHSDRRFVVTLPQACLGYSGLKNLARDLALLQVLGIRLVLLLESESDSSETQFADLEAFKYQLEGLFRRGLPIGSHRNQAIPTVVSAFRCPVDASTDANDADGKSTYELCDAVANTTSVVIVKPVCRNHAGKQTLVRPGHALFELSRELKPDKIIVLRHADEPVLAETETHSHLSTDAFEKLLESQQATYTSKETMQALLSLCRDGVPRGHIVSFENDGALLGELFTPDGTGLQVSNDDYLTIREATYEDVDTVLELLKTDVEEDRLVPRDRKELTNSDTTVFIALHDETPVGCVALYQLSDGMQEVGSLVAAAKHRDRNIGGRLLATAEREAKRRGARHTFVFSKHATAWFRNRDYEPAQVESLPDGRRRDYDTSRNSTLLIKELA